MGKLLHHQPTEGGNSEKAKYDDLYRKTLNSYTKFFGHQPPKDIWSSPDVCLSQDLYFKRVNTQENWIIAKPDIPLLLASIANNLANRFDKTASVVISLWLALTITFGAALPGLAQNSPFNWDFINVTLDVRDNGDLLVKEEQKYVYKTSSSREHYRFINLDKIRAID